MNAKNSNQLITEYVDMARRVARSMSRSVPTHKRDDLESAALLGLTEAARRFDPERGEVFGAFAVRRIRGAILDELRRSDLLTRRARTMTKHVTRAARAVEGRLGRAPTNDEIADELGVTAETVSQARQHEVARLVPMDSCEHYSASAGKNPVEWLEHREQVEQVTAALANIGTRQRRVVEMYYHEGLKLREIGERLGVTESRVSQLRSRALASLKQAVAIRAAANGEMPMAGARMPTSRTAQSGRPLK